MSVATGDAASEGGTPKKRRGLGRWLEDLLVLSAGQLLSKTFGFIAFAWLARQLTLEEYGALETAVGMSALGIIALELGTGSAGVRRISQKDGAATETLGAVMLVRLVLAVVLAPLLALTYVEFTKSDAFDMLFWIFAFGLFAMPLNLSWFFQSQEKMFVAGFGQTLKMGVFLAAAVAVSPKEHGVIPVAYAELAAVAAMALWYAVFAARWLKSLRFRESAAAGARMFKESATLGLSSFINALAQYLPLLIVAALADDRETAKFGASQRLVISLATFSYVYFFNLYPLISRHLAQDHAALDRLLSASGRVATWTGVAVCGLLSAAAPFLMPLIFGEGFKAAAGEFAVLVWIGASMLALGNAKWLLTAGQRQASLLAAHVITVAVVAGLCFLLIPRLGGVGAAIACNAGFLAQWAAAHWGTRGMAVRPRVSDNLAPVAAAMIIIIALTGLKPEPSVAIGIVVAVVVFGIALDRKFLPSFRTLVHAKSAA